jgi:hypothetical protein
MLTHQKKNRDEHNEQKIISVIDVPINFSKKLLETLGHHFPMAQ